MAAYGASSCRQLSTDRRHVDSPHEIYVGRGTTLVGESHDVEENGIILWIPLSKVRDLMKRDLLMDSGTLVALLPILANGVDEPDEPVIIATVSSISWAHGLPNESGASADKAFTITRRCP